MMGGWDDGMLPWDHHWLSAANCGAGNGEENLVQGPIRSAERTEQKLRCFLGTRLFLFWEHAPTNCLAVIETEDSMIEEPKILARGLLKPQARREENGKWGDCTSGPSQPWGEGREEGGVQTAVARAARRAAKGGERDRDEAESVRYRKQASQHRTAACGSLPYQKI
jgi:hypothetical protein